MDQNKLNKILSDHKLWLTNAGGKKADLRSADLRYADLSYADLSYANLRYADLRYADLSSADLSSADLSSANLRYANLSSADLSSADLHSADLSSADLHSADLSSADLSYTDLLTFQYQQHIAICAGERLIIGCIDKSLVEWSVEYEQIGKDNNYTKFQIQMYGKFIEMCIESTANDNKEESNAKEQSKV